MPHRPSPHCLPPHRWLLQSPLVALLALAATTAIGAPGGAQSDAKFSGMPVTGQIDDQRVIQARYGEAGTAGTGTATVRAVTGIATVAATATAGGAARMGAAGVPRAFKGGVTGIAIDSTADAGQDAVPLTFGQVFAPGDVKPSDRLVGKLADGTIVPLQIDVKARHADGSVRHALVSALLPKLAAHQTAMLTLAKDGAAPAAGAKPAADPRALLDAGFKACVSATIDGQAWSACADRLLAAAGTRAQRWIAGPVAQEWLVDAPLKNAQGAEHPHLAARFAVRWYAQARRARVDVSVENDWAYEPKPRNLTYDARLTVGDKAAYAQAGLTHFHHARWRKVAWWGPAPETAIRHASAYLIATRAVPHYDPSLAVSDRALADLAARWTGKAIEPMGVGMVTAYMPMTGGRGDIGLLPAWTTLYLLSMDPRAARVTFGTADLAGSWPIHYRDKRTGLPVSLLDHPYMTILGHEGDTRNPATGKLEQFPGCAAERACDTPTTPDVPHQPNLAYLPYLLSGDRYDLEELQFWATYDAFSSNPGYRDNVKGLLRSDQVRGQAWGLRALGEAAYITPDDDRLKAYFTSVVKHNLDWYNATYTDDARANKLGALVNGYALAYNDETGLAPWQDDFFTSAVGHLADLGFKDAGRLLVWKARFPVDRMAAPGVCWIDGAIYALTVRTSRATPFFGDMAQAYAASHAPAVQAMPCAGGEMAAALKLKTGEMSGYSESAVGYPSNMQPALAYAVDAGGAQAKQAWTLFMSRSVKPDYSGAPQFAIVPRSAVDDARDARAADR